MKKTDQKLQITISQDELDWAYNLLNDYELTKDKNYIRFLEAWFLDKYGRLGEK